MRYAINKFWRSVRGEAARHTEDQHAGDEPEFAATPAETIFPFRTVSRDEATDAVAAAPTLAHADITPPDLALAPDERSLTGKPIGNDADLYVCLAKAEALRNVGQTNQADDVVNAYLAENRMSAHTAVSLALNAQAAGDWNLALQRWREGGEAFPTTPIFVASEIAVLQILGRLPEAAALSKTASATFPGTIDVGAQRLNVLLAQKDWEEAERELDRLAGRFPDHPYMLENVDPTRQRISDGRQNLPQSTLLERAFHADGAQDWPTALRLWRAVKERDPNNFSYAIQLGIALTRTGDFDEADRVFKAAYDAEPGNLEIAANYAQVAASRPDWPEAARRWAMIIEAHQDAQIFWVMAAIAFREAGEFDAADRLLRRAIEAEPDKIELRVYHAVLSDKQEDWATSVRRWDIAHKLQPDEPNIRNSRGDAIWQEAASRLEAGSANVEQDPEKAGLAASADDEATRWKQLALQFEGLGDQCEFGIVQRRLGADPIGLFRFAAISAPAMISLLQENFDRLGDPEYTELGLTAGDEYLVRDKRGLYHMHCFVRQGSVDETKFLSQQITRLKYLKKKLISDLEDGQKIFVYKSSLERISDGVARALHAALEDFHPNTLLVLRQSEPGYEAGTLSVLQDRILIGYLNTPYGGEAKAIDFDSWRSVLKAALEYRHDLEKQIEPSHNREVSEAG